MSIPRDPDWLKTHFKIVVYYLPHRGWYIRHLNGMFVEKPIGDNLIRWNKWPSKATIWSSYKQAVEDFILYEKTLT